MIDALANPHNRNRTFIFLVACSVLAIAAIMVGIDDNPPGVILAYLSAFAFVLAFVHPWRTSKQFLRLIYQSVLVFIVITVLSNLFEFFASNPGISKPVVMLLNGAGAIFFLIAVLLCPICLLVGVIGFVVMNYRNRSE